MGALLEPTYANPSSAIRTDELGTFSRNQSTSLLTFVEVHSDDTAGVDGLDGANAIDVSPDGAHVYVTAEGDDSIAVFSRDSGTGALSFVEAEFNTVGGVSQMADAGALALSPDGRHVYVVSAVDDSVVLFSRDSITGELTFVEAVSQGDNGIDGITGASAITVSPDGGAVFVTGRTDDAIALFFRDVITGQLTFAESRFNNVDGVDGLDGPRGLARSADGSSVYAVSNVDDAIQVMQRDVSAVTVTVERQLGPSASTFPVLFDVVFSEPVTGFGESDLSLTGDANNPIVTVTPVDAQNYTLAVTATEDDGSVTINVIENAVHDEAGNFNSPSTGADNSVFIDRVAPTIEVTNPGVTSVESGEAYADPGATAADAHDGTVAVTTGGDTVDSSASVGTMFTITYDAIDAAGNTAEQMTRVISVVSNGGADGTGGSGSDGDTIGSGGDGDTVGSGGDGDTGPEGSPSESDGGGCRQVNPTTLSFGLGLLILGRRRRRATAGPIL